MTPQVAASSGQVSFGYPSYRVARDRWVVEQRGPRQPVSPDRPHGYFREEERSESGEILETFTILLTNRECPWRCVMCDLWKTTVQQSVPIGAIPAQIDHAFCNLTGLPSAVGGGDFVGRQLKLYNGGSFFDPKAIPTADYEAIARRVAAFRRVVVECHPAFVGQRCLQFAAALTRAAENAATGSPPPVLEVAMGLETVEPAVLQRLNKGMTLALFRRGAQFLRDHGIALRAFVLVKPPFLDEDAALVWANRSVAWAFDVGATVVSLIPTRGGNGAMEVLERAGLFAPPRLETLEAAHEHGIGLRRGRVFADTWDLARFSDCDQCFAKRLERLQTMNLQQDILPAIPCSACTGRRPEIQERPS